MSRLESIRSTRRFAVAVLSAFGLVTVCSLVWLHKTDPLDGWRGALLRVVFWDDTAYAPGYTDNAFEAVECGANTSSVLQLLGPPLRRTNEGNSERWWYTISPRDSHYRMREIRFSNGLVERTVHYYYVD